MIGVYCYFKDDEPVYVGASIDIDRRQRQHRNKGRFIDCEFRVLQETTTEELFDVERYYITKWNMIQAGENKVVHNNMDMPEVREANSLRMREDNPMKPGMTNSGSFQRGVTRPETYTPERNKKISESMKGENNPNYGNPEVGQRMNVRLTCETCGATMNVGNFRRWKHGPECTRKSST